ncbi:NAD(P)-binding protein [Pleomassaria siparia CBS 279.74]|uniref:NAD(P)-binding protein n=1 Tax=Pleomassaria siparia CBS 279.74 TaxID=1314801 RepID=A0A6G1JRX5_9PLEO|nr:NAD(P)-binding protein [Pleomassaria siparia CBS 279.74]
MSDKTTQPTRHMFSWLTDANYFSIPLSYPYTFITTQWRTLPYPNTSYTGQTIIITGANTGLGLESARHFARLGASTVILACRDTSKGEAARSDILSSLSQTSSPSKTTTPDIQVWPLDLCSFSSVTHFCQRAEKELDRIDVVMENAGIAIGEFVKADDAGGFESTIAVNVVSTFLLALLLLPKLRTTAARFNVEPRVVVVSSDAHLFARFAERNEAAIFPCFKLKEKMTEDRYNVSKLLSVWVVRELGVRMAAHDPVIVNALNPGFCRSDLFRHAPFPLNWFVGFSLALLGRTSEVGSRTLMTAAAAGRESHGLYMDCCEVRDPSAFAIGEEGQRLQKKVFDELMEELDRIVPGVSKNINI